MVNIKIIGDKIAEARKRTAISQAELARRLFISPQAVGKWERGESMPDITTLNRLAEILGVDLNYFSENFQAAPPQMATVESLGEQSAQLPSEKPKRPLSWDMSAGNWVTADFSGLKNLHEKFSGSNLQRCQFIGSDLSGLLLKGNHVVGCDFSRSDISGSHVQGSHVSNNVFRDCSLREAQFSGSHIEGCDFSSADFTGVTVKTSSFQKNTLVDAVWNHTSFQATAFTSIVFGGVLEDCLFENCGFAGVEFQNATLINTFFKNNNKLKRVRFGDCQADRLTYEFLKAGKADVTGITLVTL